MIQKKKKKRRSSSKYEVGHRIGETGILCQSGWRQDPDGTEGRVLSRYRGGQDPPTGDPGREAGCHSISETAEDVCLVSL